MKKITKRKGLTKEQLAEEKQRLLEAAEKRMGEIAFGRMLRCRVRYFTDGAVIGSKEFVNEAFAGARDSIRAETKGWRTSDAGQRRERSVVELERFEEGNRLKGGTSFHRMRRT